MTDNESYNTTPEPREEDTTKIVGDDHTKPSKKQMTECVICKHEIREGAKKCTECNSFQHPIRRFFSGINIQALVALVPIMALAFVFVKDQIVVHRSDLRVAVLECKKDRFRVVASNLGDRPAILNEDAKFDFVVDGVTDPRPRFLTKDPKSPITPMIKSGETVIVDYLPVTKDGKKAYLDVCLSSSKHCEYKLTFDVLSFDHKRYQIKISSRRVIEE
jgi:hypothetical protein